MSSDTIVLIFQFLVKLVILLIKCGNVGINTDDPERIHTILANDQNDVLIRNNQAATIEAGAGGC